MLEGQAEQDWIAIWESEWAAMAADRELREGMACLAASLSAKAREAAAWVDLVRAGADAPARGVSGAGAQARPAAAAAAPDARDTAIDSLVGRVEELERRLALGLSAAGAS